MSEKVSEILIQQFADGELGEEARRSVLLQLESNPEQWRGLALAFVEVQLWNQALEEEVAYRQPVSSDLTITANSPSSTNQRRPVLAFALLLVVAASAAIGFLAGNNSVDSEGASSSQTEIVRNAPSDVQPATAEMPFEEAVARSVTPVPASFRSRLLQSGYLLDENHKLTAVTLPTGEQFEIPIRQVSVRYLGNAAYQ